MIINDPNKKQHPRKFTSRNGIMSIDVGDEEKNSLIENLNQQIFTYFCFFFLEENLKNILV